MVDLTCPNCRRVFPIVPGISRGFCSCGLDFKITRKADGMVVLWTPDPVYPSSGSRSYTTELGGVPV